MKPERQYECVLRDLTPEEMRSLADELNRKIREGAQLKDARATAMANFAAQMKAIVEEIGTLSDRYTAGVDEERVEVITLLDEPERGMKSILRVDTNKIIRTEAMTAQDRQGILGFQDGTNDETR